MLRGAPALRPTIHLSAASCRCAGHEEVSCVNTMEVEDGGGGALEEETTEARLAAARNAPYPISKKECLQGWDTLIHKCWLRCDACNRWRSVPEAVRDEVSYLTACFTSVSQVPAASLTWVSRQHALVTALVLLIRTGPHSCVPRICVYAGGGLW